ncbi:hypothetical protein [Streptomyces goshikiensis]|uniref:hypothetical protein n=1 Tax=Streptomyces goshikiensis TaxID=1942 RepID=UPI00364669EB
MPANTESTTQMTGAEWMAQEQLEHRIDYAVGQLKEGKYLSLTNGPDGEPTGTCGHDPRVARDWLLGIFERRTRP